MKTVPALQRPEDGGLPGKACPLSLPHAPLTGPAGRLAEHCTCTPFKFEHVQRQLDPLVVTALGVPELHNPEEGRAEHNEYVPPLSLPQSGAASPTFGDIAIAKEMTLRMMNAIRSSLMLPPFLF
ncbi:MAG: hypothetical protein ACLPX5_02065 [Dissulfurispiraceae bacterium]